ncbi:unnamed protein product [Lampetra fluviatilis]
MGAGDPRVRATESDCERVGHCREQLSVTSRPRNPAHLFPHTRAQWEEQEEETAATLGAAPFCDGVVGAAFLSASSRRFSRLSSFFLPIIFLLLATKAGFVVFC